MTIVKWSPFVELDAMEQRMRRLFDWTGIGITPALLPAADIYETDDEYVVELEVPGYEEKELAIEVSDHTLAVKGERTATKEEITKEFTLHERLERAFERRFVLPVDADTDHVKAVFTKSVLELHAPKTKTEPKKVAITKN